MTVPRGTIMTIKNTKTSALGCDILRLKNFEIKLALSTFLLQLICTCPATAATSAIATVKSIETNATFARFKCDVGVHSHNAGRIMIRGGVINAVPSNSCENLMKPPLSDTPFTWILLTSSSDCDFNTKITHAQNSDYSALIVYDSKTNETYPMPITSKDSNNYFIFSCFAGQYEGLLLQNYYTYDKGYIVELTDDDIEVNWWFILIMALIIAIGIMVLVLCFRIAWYLSVMCWARLHALRDDFQRFARERRRSRRNDLFASALKQVAPQKWNPHQLSESCAICVEEFHTEDELRILNCSHGFHTCCIDEWLIHGRRDCPVCKRKVVLENHDLFSNTDSDTDDETAPLLSNSHSANIQYGNVSNSTSRQLRRENPFLRGNSLNIQQAEEDVEITVNGTDDDV